MSNEITRAQVDASLLTTEVHLGPPLANLIRTYIDQLEAHTEQKNKALDIAYKSIQGIVMADCYAAAGRAVRYANSQLDLINKAALAGKAAP